MTPKEILVKMGDDYLMMQALSSFNNSLANGANIVMASQTSKEDRKFSERMSNLAWERNLEAWRMQNEYNLPSNQYARQIEGLMANGLNPNLVYGNSSAVSGAAGSVSPYKFDGYHSTAVPRFGGVEPIQQLLSTRLLQTQIGAQEAQNRLINAKADNEEARNPGITAKSDEAAYRWRYITNNISDSYDAAIHGALATEYWKGQSAMHDANILRDKSKIQFYEAAMAEWLNTTNVPGTDMTYRQYCDMYKSMIPSQQFNKLTSDMLNIASEIAYRAAQGQMLNLRMEYQRYVNKYAKYGLSLGSSWITLLFTGLMNLFGDDFVGDAAGALTDENGDFTIKSLIHGLGSGMRNFLGF